MYLLDHSLNAVQTCAVGVQDLVCSIPTLRLVSRKSDPDERTKSVEVNFVWVNLRMSFVASFGNPSLPLCLRYSISGERVKIF